MGLVSSVGSGFGSGSFKRHRPRNLSELPRHLSRSQRKGLERALSQRREPRGPQVRGGVDIILFAWQRQERTDLLVMACEGIGGQSGSSSTSSRTE